MAAIMDRLWDFRKNWLYRAGLEGIQREDSPNQQNLILQVRLGDFLVKLNRTKEAIAVYERRAQEFIKKNLFAQAIALKEIISRRDPSQNADEQAVILDRLYEQMQECKTEAQGIETVNLGEANPPSQSEPGNKSQSLMRVMRLEPDARN